MKPRWRIDDVTSRCLPSEFWAEDRDQRSPQVIFEWLLEGSVHLEKWYLAKKRRQAIFSKALRIISVISVTAAGVIPLLSLIFKDTISTEWGYVALVIGAGAVLFDRVFGFSTSWARFIQTATELRARNRGFQLAWYALSRGDGWTADAELKILQEFAEAVALDTEGETRSWAADFHANLNQLRSTLPHSPR